MKDVGRAVKLFECLRNEGLTALHGEERELFDKQTRWVTDIKT
jgi:hypothetical protein